MSDMPEHIKVRMTKMERLKYYLESCGDKCHGYISDIDELLEEIKSLKAELEASRECHRLAKDDYARASQQVESLNKMREEVITRCQSVIRESNRREDTVLWIEEATEETTHE